MGTTMAGDAADVLMNVETFLTWEDGTDTRYELTDGHPVAMLPPCLEVEVLSPRTEVHDRGRKLFDYQFIDSVQEVMLVWVEDRLRCSTSSASLMAGCSTILSVTPPSPSLVSMGMLPWLTFLSTTEALPGLSSGASTGCPVPAPRSHIDRRSVPSS